MDNRKLIQGCTRVCKVCGRVCVLCECVCVCGRAGGCTAGLLNLRFHMVYYDFMGWLSVCQGLYRDTLHIFACLIPLLDI